MTRNNLHSLAVFLVALAAYEAVSAVQLHFGFVSLNNLNLWGSTILALTGQLPLSTIFTAYPPFSRVLISMGAFVDPGLGDAIPVHLSNLLGALLVATWSRILIRTGAPRWTAFAAALLIGMNPVFARTLAEGPGFALLMFGFWVFAVGTLEFRYRDRVRDVMMIGVGLAVIGISQSFGMVLLLASFPFLSLAVPEGKFNAAPGALFLMLYFPLLAVVCGMIFVFWIFQHDPTGFLASVLSDPTELRIRTGPLTAPAEWFQKGGAALAGLVAVCPIGLMLFLRSRDRTPFRLAVTAIAASVVFAILLGETMGFLPPISVTLGVAAALAAAYAVPWYRDTRNAPRLLYLLILGWFGGMAICVMDSSADTQRWRAAAVGHKVEPAFPLAADLAGALRGRDDILFDAAAAPAVASFLGSIDGLRGPATPEFQLTALRREITSAVVVVQNPNYVTGTDQVGLIFPDLYANGSAGYVRIFDSPRWRVYAHQEG